MPVASTTKQILLFGAGKSSTYLIEYLLNHAPKEKWHLTVVDYDIMAAREKIGRSFYATADAFDVKVATDALEMYLSKADLVISLLPPALHQIIAEQCVRFKKNLLTASYVDPQVKQLAPAIERAGVLFLYEMGLDPGIDHMTAMKLIHSIQRKGGDILQFCSYCGGLVSPASDDNPWSYKISWNPGNIVRAGKEGAAFKENGQVREMAYEELFDWCSRHEVYVPGVGKLAFYPNRDSLRYLTLYGLQDTPDFKRATLRHPAFCEGWHALVKLGLTAESPFTSTDGITYRQWLSRYLGIPSDASLEEKLAERLGVRPHSRVMRQLRYLGWFDDIPINKGHLTPVQLLQAMLEEKLALKQTDKDLVVMMHDVIFERKHLKTRIKSFMVLEGEDAMHTAMAKTVGLPLGIATRLILNGKINLKGLHIPILPEIYQPVLKELEEYGIRFEETYD
ncbi:saccharopine dehydrogenase C-terminal domain-containing protein [Thermoflavifilum thermophilum]|uniref:Saccharopine dehydrogenase (NADP+, L-glutamate forming) n=1 Tax=Thermoflavifilum thermophilum TaxID=1393122 RepID=A0A1I7MZM1_9BACT|nr:saccharopine dehydrogenase C-terminal domain-containing protein [Thermoflavifilum thermophilum]SFV27852.1 saccharopine dehydrogenase (NADP+, L-glutamate forming) [Thermoflavifilum thermophilum]